MLKDQFSLDADMIDIPGNPDLVIKYLDSCCENTGKLCTSVIALLKSNGCEKDTLMPFVHYIPTHTYTYLHIPTHTYTYLHIPAHNRVIPR